MSAIYDAMKKAFSEGPVTASFRELAQDIREAREAIPPNRIELYGPIPVDIVIAVCDAVSKARPNSVCDGALAKQCGATMVIVLHDLTIRAKV